MNCGLLGRKLGHSYSPQIHALMAEYPYLLYEREPEQIGDFLKNGDFTGINVTVPYKKDVIPYLDQLSPRAQQMGAVNTIVRKNGLLIGHNTDYFGFETMLLHSNLSVSGKKVLVLGSGGASNTVCAVLKDQGAMVIVISRTGENNYDNLSLHKDASVIVNTTPVGMFPHNGESPIDLALFPALEGVLDLIYNPARTKLLQDAASRGIVAMNGLLMLVAQAAEACQWFSGVPVPLSRVLEIHRCLQKQMKNMILIGMPGSGKSTVGAILAKRTGKTFVDADAIIAETAGMTIPEIFARSGEAGFRHLETEVLAKLGKASGLIIATGGGCVTREENYPLLHQNGTLFCLNKDVDQLPTDGRPISQTTALSELYRQRKPMYHRFADHHVDNNGTADAAAQQILQLWEENQ